MIEGNIVKKITGTGSAILVNLGFYPSRIEARNYLTGCVLTWIKGVSGTFKSMLEVKSGIGRLAQLAIGSTKSRVASVQFNFYLAGVAYSKAAVAAGTAPPAQTIPQNLWGLFAFSIGSDGTIDAAGAAANTDGYASEAAAIAACPAAAASHVLIGYVTVMSTAEAGFVGATTLFDADGVTANFYNADSLNFISDSGITIIEPEEGGGFYQFQIGTDSDLNVAGEDIDVTIFR